MKRTFALPLLASLLAASSFPAQAVAGTYGPPATLTVKQIPRIGAGDREILTPLPDDSALPPGPHAAPAATTPQILGLLPEDRAMPAGEAQAAVMPPAPSPIANEKKEVAEKEIASVKAVPPMPVKEKTESPARVKSSLPFPPTAEEWAARMPLGGTTSLAAAITPPAIVKNTEPVTLPEASGEETRTRQPAPGPVIHKRRIRAPLTQSVAADRFPGDDGDEYGGAPVARPAHVVVDAAATACRGYTRSVDGRRVSGTACRGGDGVWRIANERPMTPTRAVPTHMRVAAPSRQAAPFPVSDLVFGAARIGFGFGAFGNWR